MFTLGTIHAAGRYNSPLCAPEMLTLCRILSLEHVVSYQDHRGVPALEQGLHVP